MTINDSPRYLDLPIGDSSLVLNNTTTDWIDSDWTRGSPPTVVRVPLWTTLDCDQTTRTRLAGVRHKRTLRFLARVLAARQNAVLWMDPTPLLDGSINDPWSEVVAARQAGLGIPDKDWEAIFGPYSLFNVVWSSLKWRELPKCYGRYTLVRTPEEQAFMTLIPTEMATKVIQQYFSSQGIEDKKKVTETLARLEPVERVVLPNREDPIHLLPFACGGGILSYEKKQTTDSLSITSTFIHTLNSPSGWDRKLYSLGIARPTKVVGQMSNSG